MKYSTIRSALAAVLVSSGCASPSPRAVQDDTSNSGNATKTDSAAQHITSIGDGSSWRKDPKSVMNVLFQAARSGDYSKLGQLCDPQEAGDGDTRQLCAISGAPHYVKEQFSAYFRYGQVLEEPVIVEDTAIVRIMCGPQGARDERFRLIRRDGEWYLFSF